MARTVLPLGVAWFLGSPVVAPGWAPLGLPFVRLFSRLVFVLPMTGHTRMRSYFSTYQSLRKLLVINVLGLDLSWFVRIHALLQNLLAVMFATHEVLCQGA